MSGSTFSDLPEVRITKRTGILQPIAQCAIESDVRGPHERECQPSSCAEQRRRKDQRPDVTVRYVVERRDNSRPGDVTCKAHIRREEEDRECEPRTSYEPCRRSRALS